MKTKRYILVAVLCGLCVLGAKADNRPYLCELGLQGGCGYYVGDATQHIFSDVREAYGLHFRYKFTQRWALQVKGQTQRITGYDTPWKYRQPGVAYNRWENRLVNMDLMAEFNFFRFGKKNKYDKAIKPYTPYIFLGVGVGLYGADSNNQPTFNHVACYIPLGIGFKWKFSDWCGLNVAWQHNIYTVDNLESRAGLDNTHNLNGSNWLNCDLTGQVTLGIVFEFGKAAKECRICNSN